jgi:hypothetical protein
VDSAEDGFEEDDIIAPDWFDAAFQSLKDDSIVLVPQQVTLVEMSHDADGFVRKAPDDMRGELAVSAQVVPPELVRAASLRPPPR